LGENGAVEEPDPRLIRAAAAGDHDAFSDVVRAWQVPVLRYLERMLGDRSAAEDVAQEAFLRCYVHLGRYTFTGKFSTWLFSIAHNAAIDATRKRARGDRAAARLPPPRPPSDPASRVEINEALASLPVKLRSALVLIEVVGLRYREAAEVLGVPEGTVKSRVAHARDRMITWFAAREGETDALS
jgi:RNA polymerase sigma-70 factor (ECF subfamily)